MAADLKIIPIWARGMQLIDASYLYNLINRVDSVYPCLSDPVFMLLLDAREKNEYNESHIITAKLVQMNHKGEFVVPYDADLECKSHIVVYDSCTDSLNSDNSRAIQCAQRMWDMGARNEVEILQGGYEAFSAIYPFLRTQKIIYMPRELDALPTYPCEVIPGLLYLGDRNHGNCAYMQKDLKIKAHVNCSSEASTFFQKEGEDLLQIRMDDNAYANLPKIFKGTCAFIHQHLKFSDAVLVYSNRGISNSATIVIAYLKYSNDWTTDVAYERVKECRPLACPNQLLMRQLAEWTSPKVEL